MSWRSYGGGVVVSAGILVTGALWFDRADRQMRGEDLAEIAAASAERGLAFEAFGNHYVAGVRTVGVAVAWAPLGRALDETRANLQGRDASTIDPEVSSLSFFVQWLDPDLTLPADDGIVAQWDASWAQETVETYTHLWTLTLGGGLPYLYTLDTRYADGSTLPVRLFGIEPVNVPTLDWFLRGTGPAAGSAARYWGGVGNWWSPYIGGTNLYLWPAAEVVGTNGTVRYGRLLRLDALDDARAALSKMKRSVAFVSGLSGEVYGPLWNGTNTYVVTVSGASGIVTTNGTLFAAEARAKADALAAAATSTVAITNAIADSATFCELDFRSDEVTTHTVSPDATTSASSAECAFLARAYHNLRCAWPSAEAYATGAVARTRIYAVTEGLAADPLAIINPAETVTAYTTDDSGVAAYDAYDLGTGLKLGGHAFNGSVNRGPGHVNTIDAQASTLYWTLVCDSGDNPSAPPEFTLASSFSVAATDARQTAYIAGSFANGDTAERTRRRFRQAIGTPRLVVVVDWRWKHLGATPFEPAPHNPLWNVIPEE